MGDSVTTLLRQAEKLDESDRAKLAGLLLEGLDPRADSGVDAAWSETVERHTRELDQGTVDTVSWTELKNRLLARGLARARD